MGFQSSKIKDILIELHNYTFFHAPSEITNTDRRFTGREQLKQRIKTILSNSETKSGAYLITGYRGMGKTSLVAAVLNSLSSGGDKSKSYFPEVRIFIALIILALFNQTYTLKGIVFILFLISIALRYQLRRGGSREKFKLLDVFHDGFTPVRISNPATFFSNSFFNIVGEFQRTFSLFLLVSLMFWISVWCQEYHETDRVLDISHFITTSLCVFILYIFGMLSPRNHPLAKAGFLWTIIYVALIIVLFNLTLILLSKGMGTFGFIQALPISIFISYIIVFTIMAFQNEKPGISFKNLYLFEILKRHINFGHNVYIRINLGKDKISEIEVLRTVASQLGLEYEGWYRSVFPLKKTLWKGLHLFLIYLTFSLIYYFAPIFSFSQNSVLTSGFADYFPSQALIGVNYDKIEDIEEGWMGIVNDSTQAVSLTRFKNHIAKNLNDSANGNTAIPFAFDLNDTTIAKTVFSKANKVLKKFTNTLDFAIFNIYSRGTNIFKVFDNFKKIKIRKVFFDGGPNLSSSFRLMPPLLDYVFFFFLFLTIFLINKAQEWNFFGLSSHRSVRQRIRNLNDQIRSNIITEQTKNVPFPAFNPRIPIFSFKKSRKQAILGPKEIESELIAIFNFIDRIPKITIRPFFILIFDELDKIEPKRNQVIQEKESEEIERSIYGDVNSNEPFTRKETIIKLLSNFKHFLNTAKSKFIFIAGREMYDAALADVSDRDSSISSIFHDVLYVNSFFTDSSDGKIYDITSMAERYICQFLIPENYSNKDEDLNLTTYYKYLSQEIFVDKAVRTGPGREEDESFNEEMQLKRTKVITLLYKFITYIAYRSNGAPKKITALIEAFIKPAVKAEEKSKNLVVSGTASENLFLHFGYYDQYRIGLTSYLFNPFLMTISQYINDFGDKLLVSTSFLIDHIYKYNRFAFSWRNLEMTPEIISINKSPELRDFIGELISFLSVTHVNRIFSGFHQFKFNKKIVGEIQYLSKISEEESAAFNFTLDESLHLKKHYKRKIKELRITHSSNPLTNEMIHSLAYLNMIIGDLHYYDQEYDEAVIHYMEAVQKVRNIEADKLTNYLFVLMIRNMMKLGHTFEKKRNYDSAFMMYSELSNLITSNRNFSVVEFGLTRFKLTPADLNNFINDHASNIAKVFKVDDATPVDQLLKLFHKRFGKNFKEIILIGRAKSKVDQSGEVKAMKYDTNLERNLNYPLSVSSLETFYDFSDGRSILEQLENFSLNSSSFDHYYRKSIYENLRLLYQPLLAKLHLAEKVSVGGITNTDLLRNLKEFNFIVRAISGREKFQIIAEYYNKIGDLLYYKNGELYGTQFTVVSKSNETKDIESGNESISNNSGPSWMTFRKNFITSDNKLKYHIPTGSYQFYFFALNTIFSGINKHGVDLERFSKFRKRDKKRKEELELFKDLVTFVESDITKSSYAFFEDRSLRSLANCMVDFADTLISFANEKDELRIEFLEFVLNRDWEKIRGNLKLPISNIEIGFLLHYLAGVLFSKGGSFGLYQSQLLKLIHLFREVFKNNPPPEAKVDDLLLIVEHKIVNKAIQVSFKTYENITRPEIEKLRKVYDSPKPFPNTGENMKGIYANTTVSSDIQEAIILFTELSLYLKKNSDIPKNITGPYSSINKKYNRALELRVKTIASNNRFKELTTDLNEFFFNSTCVSRDEELMEKVNELKNIIIDGIFCQTEIIKTYKIFGFNYSVVTYFGMANAYEKLGDWLYRLESFKSILMARTEECVIQDINRIIDELSLELTSKVTTYNINYLSSNYNYEMALKYYYDVIGLHNEGRSFSKMIEGMYYLDDDFNDNILHFSLALERYKINCGQVDIKINKLLELIKTSPLYDMNKYL